MGDFTLYLAKHCLALCGHNENKLSHRSNFVDSAYIKAQHNIILTTT